MLHCQKVICCSVKKGCCNTKQELQSHAFPHIHYKHSPFQLVELKEAIVLHKIQYFIQIFFALQALGFFLLTSFIFHLLIPVGD